MRTSVEESGVAVVVILGAVFLSRVGDPYSWVRPVAPTRSVVRPDDDSLQQAADILNARNRITILCGAGCAGAQDELVRLAATMQAPIVHALRGKEFIEYDNPYDVGITGLLGFASRYKAKREAEVPLMLGTDFPYRQFYPEDARIIQVDVRRSHIGRRTPVDIGLVGTVKKTIAGLQPPLMPKDNREYVDRALEHYGKTRKSLDDPAINDRDRTPIRPEYVARLKDWLAADNAVFTYDVGTPTIWAARYLTMNGRRRLLGSPTHGSIGGALPHAIGAQTTDRDRRVAALAGDGGLTVMFGELATLTQNRLPVKVIVFNDSSLSFVELEMKAAGIVNFGTELNTIDFAAVAEAPTPIVWDDPSVRVSRLSILVASAFTRRR